MLKYMITDPKYSFDQIKNAIIKHKPDFVCYRNKEYFDENEIIKFINFAKNHSKVFINIDSVNENVINLADGIHLTASKLDQIQNFKNKLTIASTHSIQEVKKAKDADFITFSPIFNSKGRKGLGIEILKDVFTYHKRIIALGGIVTQEEVEEIKKSKALGFASIRYFFT